MLVSDPVREGVRYTESMAMVEAVLEDIAVSADDNQILVLLKTASGTYLPIVIDGFQAMSIAAGRSGEIAVARPLTHDLMLSALEMLDASVIRVEITDLVEETYYAILAIERSGIRFDLDARPSDALALAVRTKAPIFIAEHVLERSSLTDEQQEGGGGFQA